MARLSNNNEGLQAFGPFKPDGAGYVHITPNTTNIPLSMVTTMQVQVTQPFTVEVMGPIARLTHEVVYSPYPGPGPSSGNANEIVIIRGRWNALRIATTGDVYIGVDEQSNAYGGM